MLDFVFELLQMLELTGSKTTIILMLELTGPKTIIIVGEISLSQSPKEDAVNAASVVIYIDRYIPPPLFFVHGVHFIEMSKSTNRKLQTKLGSQM